MLFSCWCLLSLLFNHEYGDSSFLREVGVPYRTIRRHTPENNAAYNHRFENPKYNINVLDQLRSEEGLCKILTQLSATNLFSCCRLLKSCGTDRLSFTAHLECTIEFQTSVADEDDNWLDEIGPVIWDGLSASAAQVIHVLKKMLPLMGLRQICGVGCFRLTEPRPRNGGY